MNPDVAPDRDQARLKTQRTGWYGYGWASHTFEATVVAVFAGRYLSAVADNAAGTDDGTGRLHVLGLPIASGSLYSYTIGLGSLLLFVLLPIVGAIADRTGRKREMLLGFGYTSAVLCALMIFIGETSWVLGALLILGAYLTYSAAKIVYNSILPDIAGPDERDKVSSVGWAIGYMGGGVLLAINFVWSFFIDDKALLARFSLSSAGVWWMLFAIIAVVKLRHLPKPAESLTPVTGSVFTAGFRELRKTLRQARAYPLTLTFLIAYLIYYDGISTVTSMAAVYADKELHLEETFLLTTILVVQFVAFGGALLLGRLAERWGAKRTIMGGLVVWIAVVVVAYFVQEHAQWQFFSLAIVLALVLGGTQALSRSAFSGMIPRGKEAEYFSLYEVSSSGTSFLGPVLFGLTLQFTDSYRYAILAMILFFVVGLALLSRINVRKAIVDAGNTPPASMKESSRKVAV
jgi:UMF1 family MFS transporter